MHLERALVKRLHRTGECGVREMDEGEDGCCARLAFICLKDRRPRAGSGIAREAREGSRNANDDAQPSLDCFDAGWWDCAKRKQFAIGH